MAGQAQERKRRSDQQQAAAGGRPGTEALHDAAGAEQRGHESRA
jgi:hypothetical protein